MNRLFISIVVVFAIIAGLLIFQASKSGTSLVLTPEELIAKGSDVSTQRIRVAGRVAELPIDYSLEPEPTLKFSIENPGKGGGAIVAVLYKDLKPDMFASGRDVIIDGSFENGTLLATNLLTQCPSKYEPPSPDKSYSKPQ
ncbi:MAG: hypothetical protein DCC75_02555 [Proteobacteria bacterium]|nr:MAG: hypothetical protein DCC75_02555 [Pseudomonadota bacterium]